MLFNSVAFLIFLPTVFVLYWFVLKKDLKLQNLLILLASLFFYGWWDYRFLLLIISSILVDYFVGIQIDKTTVIGRKKKLLMFSLIFNLGMLGIFKYFNFFIDNWIELGKSLGFQMNIETINIILPVGISFYTFQTLSYTIDIYRGRLKPTSNFIQFAAYVSFFPQLVAGPIERASNLLPQFGTKRNMKYESGKSGIQLIIWGLFQKIVIADNCATFVNAIFNNYERLDSFSLILGAIYFSFQIYGDFAGYSNIAIGTARLFGFKLMRNFNYPYFSRDIAEFWRRWHISLSTWFRDYLYIPLGGSKGSLSLKIRNILIIFLVSGFWHGANWTFLTWGGLHALFFLPLLILKKNRNNLDQISVNRYLPSVRESAQIITTFVLTTFAWIFFRSETVNESFDYISQILKLDEFKIQYLSIERYNVELLLLLSIFVCFEWFNRNNENPLTGRYSSAKTKFIIMLIIMLGVFSEHSAFIYFQF